MLLYFLHAYLEETGPGWVSMHHLPLQDEMEHYPTFASVCTLIRLHLSLLVERLVQGYVGYMVGNGGYNSAPGTLAKF